MSIPEIAVCRDEPSVKKISGFYMVVYFRDPILTGLVGEEMQTTSSIISQRIVEYERKRAELERQVELEQQADLDWKLPTDPGSRVIEFRGLPLRYSKIRFSMLKVLILANGKAVSYSDVSQAAWGADIDREVLEDSVYQLNRFFERNRIPKFVRCSGEFLSLMNPKKRQAKKGKKKA
jgi:hypothetical protein